MKRWGEGTDIADGQLRKDLKNLLYARHHDEIEQERKQHHHIWKDVSTSFHDRLNKVRLECVATGCHAYKLLGPQQTIP